MTSSKSQITTKTPQLSSEKVVFKGQFVTVECIAVGPNCNGLTFVDQSSHYWELATQTLQMKKFAAVHQKVKVTAAKVNQSTLEITSIEVVQ